LIYLLGAEDRRNPFGIQASTLPPLKALFALPFSAFRLMYLGPLCSKGLAHPLVMLAWGFRSRMRRRRNLERKMGDILGVFEVLLCLEFVGFE